jgi:hypothetical protein
MRALRLPGSHRDLARGQTQREQDRSSQLGQRQQDPTPERPGDRVVPAGWEWRGAASCGGPAGNEWQLPAAIR